ncbi:MAG: universal stress protein [Nitrosopumilus sp.]|nr:universal stress protein [Nitrosopumilus sp.]
MSSVFNHILVPCNWTPGAQKAFKKAVKLAEICQAKITILTCLEDCRTFGFFKTKASKQEFEKERRLLEKQHTDMKNLASRFVLVDSKIVKNGKASEKILEFADRHNADLIILGKKKHSTHYEKMHYHSTMESIFRNARCAILIV